MISETPLVKRLSSSTNAPILRIACSRADGQASPQLIDDAKNVLSWVAESARIPTLRSNVALIASNIARFSDLADVAGFRQLQVLGLRERARGELVEKQASQVASAMEAEAIEGFPVRGPGLARQYYADPLLRHNHAARWLVPETAQSRKFSALLKGLGWSEQSASPVLAPHKRIFSGQGRVEIELHSRPFAWMTANASAPHPVTPEFAVAEIIGAALVERQARTNRWVIDIVHIARSETVDGGKLAELLHQAGLARLAAAAIEAIARLIEPVDARAATVCAEWREYLDHGSAQPAIAARAVNDLLWIDRALSQGRRHILLQIVRHPVLARKALKRWAEFQQGRRAALSNRDELRDVLSRNREQASRS